MIKFISLPLALMLLTLRVSAESYVYITDQLDLPIRSDKSFGNNIIRLLPSGTELSLLQSTEDGWAQIQFDDTIGWIKSFYLSPDPAAREKLKKLTRTDNVNKLLISKLSGEKEELESQLLTVKQENTDLIVQSSKSQAEKEHIEQIYQDALKLEHENEKLIQEKLQLKAELQLSVNNTQIQKDTSSRNWFIVGAIVLFFGMIIGFIVPGLLNRRRY
ncbi:TIGR04211 family SH3 domain-containing protein [Candidatus Pseudothioglobus singularis]|nr:TIGR04211 family SH3 domain-containing protein [Candidatus Pseudothioglobus singularis]MDB4822488.1 TIGR04211 family SH3 domain-containing protein [Candidatus Pseudothioglobus singularis]